MIPFILAGGLVLTGIVARIKGLSDTTRALVCWTLSALTFGISMVVFLTCSGEFTFDGQGAAAGAAGTAVLCVLILLIEMISPTNRLRKREKAVYNNREAERALNLVFVLCCVVLAVAAAAADALGETFITGFCLIPAAAVSIRQLSFSLFCAKSDTAEDISPKKQREKALKKLGTGNREL